MKKLLFPVVALLIVVSCSPKNENALGRNPANEELVKNFMKAYSKGDTISLDKFFADNFRAHGPGLSDSTDKAGFIMETKKYWRDEWQSTEFDRIAILSSTFKDGRVPGDWVFDWGFVTITYKNGAPPTKFPWHGVYKIENGKITEGTSYYDRYEIMNQLGLLPVLLSDSSALKK